LGVYRRIRMAKLKCGHEICDTCGKRYIALLAKDSCMCEIDPTHTDPGEKETALALKYRQRARVAEDLNKELARLILLADCPECDGSGGVPQQVAEADWVQQQCQWCFEAGEALGSLDKQLEDIPGKPESLLQECKWQFPEDGTVFCRKEVDGKYGVMYGKPCEKNCIWDETTKPTETPTKGGE
jgi:hypothetical protein